MRRFAKWTFLCVICTAIGFGATFLVANKDRVIQTVVAMLPVPSQTASDELVALETLDVVAAEEVAAIDGVADKVNAAGLAFATELAALPNSASPLLSFSTNATMGTLSSGPRQLSADVAQNVPSTGALSAVGVIAVARDRQVVLGANGRVDEIAVEVGDQVSAGDLLIALDTTYLDWSVEQAEIGFETARIDFEEAGKEIDDSDVAVAEANLLVAQENLAVVEAGPTSAELAAAESAATAAWSRLSELQEGPNPNQVIIAQAALRRAEIAVEGAQREYDKIAWLPEAAATSAADNLQSATIALESARATYAESMEPATASAIQGAMASAQSAQASLDLLRLKPTPAELATARAAVASAEATLANAQEGPQQAAVRKAELGVRQAMIALENARLAQSNASVLAPIDGTVLSIAVDLGQSASAGQVVATLADTSAVKLTVNVEQRDIARVLVGQEVQISIYALASETFTGVVEQIAPIADAGSGFVTFPVIIRFTEGPVDKILPGMTASATFVPVAGESSTSAPAAPAATATPTVEPTAVATEVATEEATEEATPEATVEPTEEPTEEADAEETPEAEASPEATEEPTEEPSAEATATPSN